MTHGRSPVPKAVTAYAALAARRGISLIQLSLGYVGSRWFAETLAGIAAIEARYPNRTA